jgi:hypothetical protein
VASDVPVLPYEVSLIAKTLGKSVVGYQSVEPASEVACCKSLLVADGLQYLPARIAKASGSYANSSIFA